MTASKNPNTKYTKVHEDHKVDAGYLVDSICLSAAFSNLALISLILISW
jgi:hypothetical protein